MSDIPGVPEHARESWLVLHRAITQRPYPTPCQGEDAALWYGGKTGMARAARECADCPVVGLCANYALEAGERFGVWGGLTPTDRAALNAATTRKAQA